MTLTRTPAGLTVEVNGLPDTLDRAVRILHGATSTTMTAETRLPVSPATHAHPLAV
ncbi:hypothetical protein ACFOUS_22050 [Deinococcus metalli]|uniref:hypothetical protein n=1 Tax=Deinococcus metalli TaxID=1141878 RepID=UPI001748A951